MQGWWHKAHLKCSLWSPEWGNKWTIYRFQNLLLYSGKTHGVAQPLPFIHSFKDLHLTRLNMELGFHWASQRCWASEAESVSMIKHPVEDYGRRAPTSMLALLPICKSAPISSHQNAWFHLTSENLWEQSGTQFSNKWWAKNYLTMQNVTKTMNF